MVMSYVGKMFTELKMDSKGLSNLLGDQLKMINQSSPERVTMAKHAEEKCLMDKLKNSLGS